MYSIFSSCVKLLEGLSAVVAGGFTVGISPSAFPGKINYIVKSSKLATDSTALMRL